MLGSRVMLALGLITMAVMGALAEPSTIRRTRGVDFKSINPRSADQRLPSGLTPVSYFLQLQPFMEQDTFRGHVYINVSVGTELQQLDVIRLHAAPELRVKHVTLDEARSPDGAAPPVTPPVLGVEREGDILVVRLAAEMRPGAFYRLGAEFSGALNNKTTEGIFKGHYVDQESGETHFYVATHFKPSLARSAFPCFDEPALKAPFSVSVARPRGSTLRSVSNMPHVSTLPMVNDLAWVWDSFEASPPMSTYAVSFLTSDLVQGPVVEQSGDSSESVSVRVWSRAAHTEQTEWAREVAPRALALLEKRLRVRFPLPKIDLVALPGFSAPVPAENWGIIFYREGDILSGGGGYNRWVTSYVVNELTMQWLGGLVTPRWWSHAWLNRALTNFIARAAAAELEPLEERVTQEQSPAAAVYALYYEYSRRRPYARLPSMRDIISATKAEVVIRMLNATLAEETFPAALQDFMTERQYGTYEQSDLWAAVGRRAHSDGSLPLTVSAKAVAASWMDSERFPVLTVSRDYRGTLSLAQRAFVRDPTSEGEETTDDDSAEGSGLWWVPLVMAPQPAESESAPDLAPHRAPALWMPPTSRIDNLSDPAQPNKFLLVNPEDIGLFLVNYDTANWGLLGEFLQGPRGSELPPATRAKLVHDALNLALGGQLDFPTALTLTRFLATEQRYEPWQPFFNMASVLDKKLDGTQAGKLFAEYAVRLASPLESSLGEGGTAGEAAWRGKLRSHLRHLLCSMGHQPCVQRASDIFARWNRTENPDANIPVPTRVFCSVFAWGSRDEWLFGLERLSHLAASAAPADRMYLLKTLAGCPRDPWRVERLLNASLLEAAAPGTEPFSEADVRLIFAELSGRHTGSLVLFRFLEKHWQHLKNSMHGRPMLWSSLVAAATGHFKTFDELEMVMEFAQQHRGEFGSAEGAMRRALQHVELEASWSQRHVALIQDWLSQELA